MEGIGYENCTKKVVYFVCTVSCGVFDSCCVYVLPVFLWVFVQVFYRLWIIFRVHFFGLRYFGELVFSVITGTTVLVVLLFIVPLAPLLVIGTWINFFVRPLKNVSGFENYGKVCEAVKLFTSQGPKGKRLTAATALAIILAYLFLLLWFLTLFRIVTVNLSSLFLGLGITSLLLVFYFGFRIERELREYAKTFRV
ncbi:MAG: hypothetical protein ACTSV0_03340 [Candidatus Freyarchaeota archaeon]